MNENEKEEHLATVTIEGKEDIIFSRLNKDTLVTRGDKTVKLPKASGMQTLEMLALLEDLGKLTTEEEE